MPKGRPSAYQGATKGRGKKTIRRSKGKRRVKTSRKRRGY